MASVRKTKSGNWAVQVRIQGKISNKTFPSKIEANNWGLVQEKEFSRGDHIIRGNTLGDAFKRYAREVSPSKKGARWEIIRLKKLQRLALANVQMDILCADDITDWMKEAGETLSDASILRELNLISSVIECARKLWQWTHKNPCRDVLKPKNPPSRDRRISQDEIDRILLALHYEENVPVTNTRQGIAVAFLLALETGMRQGEIWGMTWDNVFLDEKFVFLPDTKNGYNRTVPLPARAVQLLTKMGNEKGGGRVIKSNQASCGAMFRSAVKLANIKGLTFHDTRHEACTRLARKLDMLDLAKMIGHRDPRSLMIYYNPTPAEIANRVDG